MIDLPGVSLSQERESRALDIAAVASAAKITPRRLRAFEADRGQLEPVEIERLIAVLAPTPDSVERIRHAASTETQSVHNVENVAVYSSARGGIDPWTQALYATEMGVEGTRMAAQGYLSAAVRPIELTLKQYAWDGASAQDLSDIADVLKARQDRWIALVQQYVVRDIYPRSWIERYCGERMWMGHRLDSSEVARHLAHVETALQTYSNYFVGLMAGEELYFNFIIEGSYVLVEGAYEIEPEPKEGREVSGLRIGKPEVVKAFRREFERVWHDIPLAYRDKGSVISWFHDQRDHLRSVSGG